MNASSGFARWRRVEVPSPVDRGGAFVVEVSTDADGRCPDRLRGHLSPRTVDGLRALVRRAVLDRVGLGEEFGHADAAVAELAAPRETAGAWLLFVPGLEARPFWPVDAVPALRELALAWKDIAAEAQDAACRLARAPDQPHLTAPDAWKQFHLWYSGRPTQGAAEACPRAIAVLRSVSESAPVSRAYISALRAGATIAPHHGPHNARLRSHLGLVAPAGAELRVDGRAHRWTEGGLVLFDDSFRHEASNPTARERVVLVVDVPHPGLGRGDVVGLAAVLSVLTETARRLGIHGAPS